DFSFSRRDFTDIKPVSGNPGDVYWGPNPESGQGGKPDKGEEDGDDGDEPGGAKPSEDGGDELFETVSLDEYADALATEITLPNLRPKAGLDMTKEDDINGRRNRTSGMPVNRQIMRNAFKRGFPTPQEVSEGANPFDSLGIINRGLTRLRRETDWVVRQFEPKKSPDVNAVVFFQMDMSGSMEIHKKAAKQALYDLRAMLQRKYKSVKFVYIAFNDKAYVYDDPNRFFSFKPEGGTRYARSFQKTVDLYTQFPAAQFDRFSVVVATLTRV
ncbi:MAG: DUF444 family protein, partial [Calothrix sp. SM1_5_4]|nr:DUF444 family protein [Calothrix sp. SM1_5_4]